MKAYVVKARAKLGHLPNLMDYENLILEQDPERKFEKAKNLYDGLNEIKDASYAEHELDLNLSKNIKSISYFLEGYEKEFFEKYVSSLEIRLIQNIIQGIMNNSLNENIYIFKNNPFSKNLVIKKDMKFDDFVKSTKDTRYHRTLVPFLNENITKDSMIFLISNSLTKFYYRDLLDYSQKFPKNLANKIKIYIGKEIDIYNIEMLYRLKKFFDLKAYEIFNYLIEGGYKLKADKLKELSKLAINDFKNLIIEESPYANIFSNRFDINKSIMEERYNIIKNLNKEDNILYLIYAINLVYISNRNIMSILQMDDSFTIEEQKSLLIMG